MVSAIRVETVLGIDRDLVKICEWMDAWMSK